MVARDPIQDVVRGEHHQVHHREARPVDEPLRVVVGHVRRDSHDRRRNRVQAARDDDDEPFDARRKNDEDEVEEHHVGTKKLDRNDWLPRFRRQRASYYCRVIKRGEN